MSIQTLRQLIRLLLSTNFSNRRIAQLSGTSPTTVRVYRQKLQNNALSLEDMTQLADNQLTTKLSERRLVESGKRQPDWAHLHQLMQAKHQTLIQLWEDYRTSCPADAYSYSQFTHHYRKYVQTIDVSMRQYYAPGEVVFVDFAGQRIPWVDTTTGETQFAEIFVGVLGYSQLVFAVALRSQKLEDWLDAHSRMLLYYGGVPQLLVPDNLKSAVTTPGKLPQINPSYQELSEHYGFVIEPAQVRRPQDKSLAEIGVLLVTRWITVVLRRQQFFSIADINESMKEPLEYLNQRPFKRYEGNRRERFESHEKTTLAALPLKSFDIGRWIHQKTVDRDHHVLVLNHNYSVPYELKNQTVDIKVCQNKIEIYFQHKLVALHVRGFLHGGSTTELSHRPKSHQLYAQQSKSHFMQWATDSGESVLAVVLAQFANKPEHSIQGGKAYSRLQKLARQYGAVRFEKACRCACDIQSLTVSSVRSILQCHLDEPVHEDIPVQAQLPLHHNVRGAEYFVNGGL